MTYEEILNRVLENVSADVDKTEGSVVYDAVSPCCLELAQCYTYIEELEKRVFVDTSYGEYLDRRVIEQGITRKEAVYAIRKATFNVDVPIGSRWAKEELVYTVTEKVQDGVFKVKCNQTGSIGNQYSGNLINMDAIENINSAILGEIVVNGSDEEDDESLRTRYLNKVRRPSTSGNIYDYENWAMSIDEVGGVKVLPLWNGAGTVKVLVTDKDSQSASSEIVKKVSDYIETVRPIGATVTVQAPNAKSINIKVTVSIDSTTSLDSVNRAFKNEVIEYLSKISLNTYTVSYAVIGSLLLSIDGVLDYENLTVNGGNVNVKLNNDEIPTLGTFEVSM